MSERVPHQADLAKEGIKTVVDPDCVGVRRSNRNKFPSTRLRDYKTSKK